ncbi:MAG: bifunctional 4-hydroxy-3-methylbut-2-enyl diphosphate reductase/30S ribosomal protein S1 [Clostridiales Family XIII bacterium]|jgi:4-hydroxy-3-methylbut-2-enyl diphosphate reductase|nr:bifunctional 4-hydroxy-3-methylbut-2-enyl diphosphate reductase/30S ribosomal protein S1 [Clostridiales Family XIII bacterium]
MTQERATEIRIADHLGYCFGVREALAVAEAIFQNKKESGENPDKNPVYACGPLIHNEQVMKDLERKGLIFLDNLDEAGENGVVIIRTHGEPAHFYEAAEKKKLKIADVTCPFVKRIQKLVNAAHADGFQVVIAGERSHPEVMGINGWCQNEAVIVKNAEEARQVQGDRIFAVAQTTMAQADFDEITKNLQKEGRTLTVKNTICIATAKRQESCGKLAETVDAMVVIGGKHSANTQKLFGIAKKKCKKSYFVENIEDLPLKELRKCNTIGITAGASTPDRMIKEVIANMTVNTENNERNPMADFMEEIEKSLRLPRTGEIVTGTVIQVSNRDVIVNLGCKKDGVIPKDEIVLEPEQTLLTTFKEGDEVQAKVLKTDDGDGNILLSKKKVVINEHWEDINRAFEDKGILEAKIVKEVNGGVIAVFKEIYGFIPLSQLSDRFVDKADDFIGKVLQVRVTRLDQKRNKVVFSHKSVLAEERQKRLLQIWESLSVGDVIEGTVMRFTDYGAFVDIGGIDGLLHISEISWGKLKHPQEILKIGEKIPVKILSIIKEKEKISLGYKQNQPEPWSVIGEKYKVGQIIQGRAVQIKEYGVFVELEPGLDGLVHISEIAFKRVNNISDELSVGQEVSAKILEIDKDRKRISLSIKETLDRSEEAAEGATPETAEDVTEIVEIVEVAEEAAPEAVEVVAEDAAPEAAEVVAEEAAPEIAEETAAETVAEAVPEIAEEAAPEEAAPEEAAPEAAEAVAEAAAPEAVEVVAEEAAPEIVEVAEEAVPEIAEEAAPEAAEEAAPEIEETVAEETAEDAANTASDEA